MKVCFIDPKGMHLGLNTGLGYLASYLKTVGEFTDIKVFDFNNRGDALQERIEEIRSYDAIGFSIKSFTRDAALAIAGQVKTRNNFLFAGGPHITLDGANFLGEHSLFHAGVQGEGEVVTAAFLSALRRGHDLRGIQGLVFRDGTGVTTTGSAARIAHLDALPYPDYSVFDSLDGGKIGNYPLVTSRGCPYLCIYCCVKGVMGKKWIARSVENVVGELQQAVQRYEIKGFNVQDDNFSLDMARAKAVCDALVDEGLSLKWSCPNGLRADRVDEELMVKMKNAGCFAVALGIETGVEKEFRAIKKGEKLADVVRAVDLANRNKVLVFGNFIVGLPHATLQSTRRSVDFAKRLKLEACIFNLFVPFPGTEIWDWVSRNGRMLMDWKEGFTQGSNPKIVFETDEFPARDRLRAYFESNIKSKNYFAFMDEHDGLLHNILNILQNIFRYDARNLLGHLSWWVRHAPRILARIVAKKGGAVSKPRHARALQSPRS